MRYLFILAVTIVHQCRISRPTEKVFALGHSGSLQRQISERVDM